MKSVILANTLNKLESDLSIDGDERRNTAINDIAAVLEKSYKEYFSCDNEQKRTMISDLILEQKKQINEKIEQLIENKEEKLLNRIYTAFILKSSELERKMNETEDKLEEVSINNVKSDIQEIMSAILNHFIIERENDNIKSRLPVPTEKYNVFQELWKKVREKFHDIATNMNTNKSNDKPAERTYTAKHIRDYVFSESTEAEESEAKKFEYKLRIFKERVSQSSKTDLNKSVTEGNYGKYQVQNGMRRPVDAPGYEIQKPLGYGQYQTPKGVRRPIDAPGYGIQQPLGNEVINDNNHEFLIPFEKLGIDPSKVKDKSKLEINGKKYIKMRKGLIEIIESHTNEGDER